MLVNEKHMGYDKTMQFFKKDTTGYKKYGDNILRDIFEKEESIHCAHTK